MSDEIFSQISQEYLDLVEKYKQSNMPKTLLESTAKRVIFIKYKDEIENSSLLVNALNKARTQITP